MSIDESHKLLFYNQKGQTFAYEWRAHAKFFYRQTLDGELSASSFRPVTN